MKILTILFIFVTVLFAKENLSILITKFKQAPNSQKYIYMNKIKILLRNINAKDRLKVITNLKHNLVFKNNTKINNDKTIKEIKIHNISKTKLNCNIKGKTMQNQGINKINHFFKPKH